MSVIPLVLPDFLLIALGWVLYNRLRYSAEFFQYAEKLVYFVLFPALLFRSIIQTPLSPASALQLLQAVVALLVVGLVALWLAKLLLRPTPRDYGSVAQCAYRFNTYIGLSLALALGGERGQSVMAVLVGLSVPLVNVAAVHGLARQQPGARLVREIVRNPLIIATVLALVGNFLHISLPQVLDVTLARLGACALAVGLLCVGATLAVDGGRGAEKLMGAVVAIRLLLMPLAAVGIGWALGLPVLERQMLLLFGALPTASSAYVLAARMGGNGPLVAVTMSLSTVLAIVTIPLWLMAMPNP
ncbi:AEC family transporter [Pusillimonas sp. TS35]|jgi:predicted permease|uniref:AEC family transporter n=1 Tax=Paracandidimonas lactea TaxID=2895524 RepID=UPI00136EE169|nr:AEC family transporter [Paracandidimonas lactea]MYN13228.1 AEC family transporter [Pusillimonas sp. TS35]